LAKPVDLCGAGVDDVLDADFGRDLDDGQHLSHPRFGSGAGVGMSSSRSTSVNAARTDARSW